MILAYYSILTVQLYHRTKKKQMEETGISNFFRDVHSIHVKADIPLVITFQQAATYLV